MAGHLDLIVFSPFLGVCPPCDNEMNSDVILEHMCGSEFGKESFMCCISV